MQKTQQEVLDFASRHGQAIYPNHPIKIHFSKTVEKKIKNDPLGAIMLAAMHIDKWEEIYRFIFSLPIDSETAYKIIWIIKTQHAEKLV